MKKLICIILTAVLLLLCACNVVTPPAESGKDSESDTPATPDITPSESSDASPESSEPKETESEKQQTSETPPPISSSEEPESSEPKESKPSSGSSSGSSGERAHFILAYGYEEYLEKVAEKADVLPDNFITFDMIGENFKLSHFETYTQPWFFRYFCFDEIGGDVRIDIQFEEDVRKEFNSPIELSASDFNNSDYFWYYNGAAGFTTAYRYTYILDQDTKIIYDYFYGGQLINIYWNWRDQIIKLHIRDYPFSEEVKDAFIAKLSSKKTAKDTVLEFNQRLDEAMANK